jgi:hypothetical protein
LDYEVEVGAARFCELHGAYPVAENFWEEPAPGVVEAVACLLDTDRPAECEEEESDEVEAECMNKMRQVFGQGGDRGETVAGVMEIGIETTPKLVVPANHHLWVWNGRVRH